MRPAAFLACTVGLLAGCETPRAALESRPAVGRHELLDPARIDAATLERARSAGVSGIVLCLGERAVSAQTRRAAQQVRDAGLELGYWVEVGRSETLAATRPDLMASLQGHDEWRRAFPRAPVPRDGEVVKAWPWVPVAYSEAFALHLDRVEKQLTALPAADVVYLNDLQGPPSACGCGNPICRWATDYTLGKKKPLRTAGPPDPAAAARFVSAVRRIAPKTQVVPVWVTECEEHDREEVCGGVGCYRGACWREFDRQWTTLVAEHRTVALLLTHATFDRSTGWPRGAVQHLRRRVGTGVRWIAVVEEGADPIPGVDTMLWRRAQVPQSFAPRLVRVR